MKHVLHGSHEGLASSSPIDATPFGLAFYAVCRPQTPTGSVHGRALVYGEFAREVNELAGPYTKGGVRKIDLGLACLVNRRFTRIP